MRQIKTVPLIKHQNLAFITLKFDIPNIFGTGKAVFGFIHVYYLFINILFAPFFVFQPCVITFSRANFPLHFSAMWVGLFIVPRLPHLKHTPQLSTRVMRMYWCHPAVLNPLIHATTLTNDF